MRFVIFLFSITGIFFSCNNSPEESDIEEPTYKSSMTFGDKNYTFPELSSPAKVQAVQWGVLEDLLSEAKNLNGSNFQDLKNRSERLTEYSDSLFKKIPDTLNTNMIRSRLMVLKTRSELLFQITHRGTMDSADLQKSVVEMNSAVKNLIVHLNEKFQKDKIDSQRIDDEKKELKQQKKFRDSVMNSERQDLKNRKL